MTIFGLEGGAEDRERQGHMVRQGCNLSPILFNLYINEFACQLDQSTAPDLNLNGTEVKGLLSADDLAVTNKRRSTATPQPPAYILSVLGSDS